MPLYHYRALDRMRREIKGELTANNPDDALKTLQKQGLLTTSLKEKKQVAHSASTPPKVSPVRSGWFNHVPLKHKIHFTHQLTVMHHAGMTILHSLKMLQRTARPGIPKRTLNQIIRDIENGSTFAEALSRHPGIFDLLYVKMIEAGESSGILEIILKRLTASLQYQLDLRRKMIRAMTYPILILTATASLFTLILLVGIPFIIFMVGEQATSSGPLLILKNISQAFIRGFIFLPLTAILAWLGIRTLKKTSPGRHLIDSIKLSLPILGRLTRKKAYSRISRTMGNLIEAGIPIVEAIGLTSQVAGNEIYRRRLLTAQEDVREGKTFEQALRSAHLSDPVFLNMVEVGEETGDLDKMMLKIAEVIDEEVESIMVLLLNLLEVGVMIVVGLTMAAMIFSIFSSIYGSVDAFL